MKADMFIGAYWSERKESKELAAERIAGFLGELAGMHDAFATWYRRGATRAAAMRSPMGLDAASIVTTLKPNRRDIDRQPIAELGYNLGVWNGADFSFMATIGCWNRLVGNTVVLSLGTGKPFNDDSCRDIVEAAVRAFDPDHAVATSDELLNQVRATTPWQVGFCIYHRGEGIIQRAIE